MKVADDGLAFHEAGVRVEAIRNTQDYGGVRVGLMATLGNARIPLQVEIGFGDAVTPGVETVAFPTLLDFPTPTIQPRRRASRAIFRRPGSLRSHGPTTDDAAAEYQRQRYPISWP